jgi:hypothetical protein
MFSKQLGQFVADSKAEPDAGQQAVVNAASIIASRKVAQK